MIDSLWTCIRDEHDAGLLVLAAVILAASTTIAALLFRLCRTTGRTKWAAAAGAVAGAGVWSTHFVAMLGYGPGGAIRYHLTATAASLGLVLVSSTLAFVGLDRDPRSPARAGLLFGAGVAAMHYLGTSGLIVGATAAWDGAMVAVSLAASAGFAAAGFRALARPGGPAPAIALLVVGVLAMHFTGMAALSWTPAALPPATGTAIEPNGLATAVGGVMAGVLAAAGMLLVAEARVAAARREAARLRDLADAAFEGIAILDGDRVLHANGPLERLLGGPADGRLCGDFLVVDDPDGPVGAATGLVLDAHGGRIPVEVQTSDLTLAGQLRRVLAIRDVRERNEQNRRIRHLASHDALTGLRNRASLERDLARRLKKAGRSTTAVLCLDLDRFKEVNDIHGHPVGDALLKAVAERLAAALPAAYRTYRLGGDEFVAVGPAADGDGMETIARRLIAAIGEPFVLAEATVRVGLSVGSALHPHHADDASGLLRKADVALYRAKSDGKGRHRAYEPDFDTAIRQRRELEDGLRVALSRGEIFLDYQPQVAVGSGAVTGYEALMRWRHPTLGLVPPARFIPVAEETALIFGLGAWLMEEACTEAAAWAEPLTIAVNLSPVEFEQPDLVAMVHRTLLKTGLAPGRLELELTEMALVRDQARAFDALRRLRALGVRIALDDFGTGYASMSYLHRFPFDTLKVDGSFIADIARNPRSSAIVDAVIALGRDLGVRIVAEGVETRSHLEDLESRRCPVVQGYHVGRPGPAPSSARARDVA